MFDTVREWFASVDWNALFANVTNDKLIALFTHPYGMAGLGVLLVVSLVLKWRVTFAVLAGALALSFVVRSTVAGPQSGPNKNILLLSGGAVVVGAFLIYWLFIRDE